MPCPRHGLTLAIHIEADAISQTWSYTSSRIYMLIISQTCLTLAQLLADACPRHVLHWLSSSRPMHVLDMSYTGTHLYADAMSQTWSYTSTHNGADVCPRHVLHWHTRNPNVMA
ncbi:T-cell surface glycoprotein CD1b-1 [Gossypium arboreum]|uniref:T-cell surface glycoprotein CD1b-1 n=1 Tax=Gossypium arboreum TaxID=29729 RepID=A0A0B0MVU2_GOSAR|nr:T-cell surface glycoprotein CD1b-1 [Gossypium arboreum]